MTMCCRDGSRTVSFDFPLASLFPFPLLLSPPSPSTSPSFTFHQGFSRRHLQTMASFRAKSQKVHESLKAPSPQAATPAMPCAASRALIPNPADAASFIQVFKELSLRAVALPPGSEDHREIMKEIIDIGSMAMDCVKNLSETLDALNNRIDEFASIEAQLKCLQDENEELKDIEQDLEDEVSAGEERLEQLKKENKDLKDGAQNLEDQLQALRSANALLLTENFTYELEKAAAAGTPDGGHKQPLVRRAIMLHMLPADMTTAMLSKIVRGGKVEHMHVYSSASETGYRSAIVSFFSQTAAVNFHEWVTSAPAVTIQGVRIRSELTLTNPPPPTNEGETRVLEVRVPQDFSVANAKDYMANFARCHNLCICIQSVQTSAVPHNGASVARYVFEGTAMATRVLKALQSQGLRHADAGYSRDECEDMLWGKKVWGIKARPK